MFGMGLSRLICPSAPGDPCSSDNFRKALTSQVKPECPGTEPSDFYLKVVHLSLNVTLSHDIKSPSVALELGNEGRW